MIKILKMTYPELPPSSNKIYARGTILRQEARTYAENFAKYAAQNHLHTISQLNAEGVFILRMKFYFPTLVNKSWDPDRAGLNSAKSRYKRIDLTNRIKLLEDCIRDAIDIDDCQTFASYQEKHHDPSNPRVEIEVEEIDPSLFGL